MASKIDFEYLPNTNNYIKFGLDYIYHPFRSGISVEKNNTNRPESPNVDTTYGNTNIYANEFAAYIENK